MSTWSRCSSRLSVGSNPSIEMEEETTQSLKDSLKGCFEYRIFRSENGIPDSVRHYEDSDMSSDERSNYGTPKRYSDVSDFSDHSSESDWSEEEIKPRPQTPLAMDPENEEALLGAIEYSDESDNSRCNSPAHSVELNWSEDEEEEIMPRPEKITKISTDDGFEIEEEFEVIIVEEVHGIDEDVEEDSGNTDFSKLGFLSVESDSPLLSSKRSNFSNEDEREIEEDEITSDTEDRTEEYDADHESSDSDVSDESEERSESDNSYGNPEENFFTPANVFNAPKNLDVLKNDQDMLKGLGGEHFFTTNSTPWSFVLILPFGPYPIWERMVFPPTQNNIDFIEALVGVDWARKLMNFEGFREFARHFRFRGKACRERCLFILTKRKSIEAEFKAPAPTPQSPPLGKSCKRRLFQDDWMDQPPMKKSYYSQDPFECDY